MAEFRNKMFGAFTVKGRSFIAAIVDVHDSAWTGRFESVPSEHDEALNFLFHLDRPSNQEGVPEEKNAVFFHVFTGNKNIFVKDMNLPNAELMAVPHVKVK